MTLFKFVQPENVFLGMELNPSEKNAEEREVHPAKTSVPQVLMLPGSITDVRLVQPRNTPVPSIVTLFGITIDLRARQLWKACSSIVVTVFGIFIEHKFEQP